MDTSLTRWWIHKTKGKTETYTTADLFALSLAVEDVEECLLHLYQIRVRLQDLEIRAVELLYQIRFENLNDWPADNLRHVG